MKTARGAIWLLLTAGLATAAITVLFLSMRAVMRIGGSCASGGPFEIRNPCPKGIAGLMIGSVWIGLNLSYLFPTLPPSSMIIGAAVAVYTLTLCIAAARDPQAIRQRLTGPPLHHAHEH